MISQGPFTLTLGTTLPLEDPGATSNNPATAVQLQNASPFVIDVNVGGAVFTIQSFTAQTVPTSGGGQQMSVSPAQSNAAAVSSGPDSLTVVWLLAGESAPMIDGPLTAAAIASALSTQGSVDTLYENDHAIPSSPIQLGPFPALHSYTTIVVVVQSAPDGTVIEAVPFRLAGFASTFWTPQSQSVPSQGINAHAVTFSLPCAFAVGDSVYLAISGTPSVTNALVSIFGLSTPTVTEVITPIGVPLGTYVVGGSQQVGHSFSGAGSSVLLAAPPAGFVYVLKRFLSSQPTSTFTLVGTTSGFLYSNLPASQVATDNLEGLPAPEGLTATASAGGGAVFLFYDLVPVLTIQ